MKLLCLVGLLAVHVLGDCYLHMPRGSNNRLNEKSANRNNGNRLFDSQNNNRGGYNKGDYSTGAAAGQGQNQAGSPFNKEINNQQYSEVYYEGSVLPIEWTAQHGCGGHETDDVHKLNCNMVVQFMCNTDPAKVPATSPYNVELKDGRNTNTPNAPNNPNNVAATKAGNDAAFRGRHESEAWYMNCKQRKRNLGLFTADQKLKGDKAIYTRQNPNGGRRGLECPEERDYYPYWRPSPWMDIAVLTDTPTDCKSGAGSFDFLGNSQNTVEKFACVPKSTTDAKIMAKAYAAFNGTKDCPPEVGTWTPYKHGIAAPKCEQAEWSRVNHLGNGRNGQPLMYNWTLPKVNAAGLGPNTAIKQNLAKCVLRMRYNISTDDYDPRNTTAAMNHDKKKGIISPVQQNPTVDIGASLQGLKLAINTAQFGRTFQDRSHTFYIKKRTAGMDAGAKIHNLQARGKRGNIVQTFPSVEYDFQPSYLEVKKNEYIHVQWTGSNTHNNGNPAGDGQAGDAGEGTGGTDRHNMACLEDRAANYPVPIDNEPMMKKCLFTQFDCFKFKFIETGAATNLGYMNADGIDQLDWKDCAAYLATGGFYKTDKEVAENAKNMNALLNNVPASLHAGILLKPKASASGDYHYMNTRNNNFSNRSQKGTIIVK